MRRAPAKPVRACTLRNWCHVSHVTLEAPRHTSHLTDFTLHTAPFAVNTSHFSVHTALSPIHTSHSTLHTSQSTLHTSHCFLHTPHFTLHTALFTPHTSHFTLHTPHFISSELFSALLQVSKVEGNSCWCIASNRNGKCEHSVVVTCQGDSRSPSSTAAFFPLRYTWSSRLLAAFRPALARKAGELITLEAWLAVMALHEANQARSSHYPQWHCGPKLHLLALSLRN